MEQQLVHINALKLKAVEVAFFDIQHTNIFESSSFSNRQHH